MPKNNLIKSELLKELAKNLPDFTQDEFVILVSLLGQHQQEVMKLIQLANPKVHGWIQEKHQQLEQEKTDKEIEKFQKYLEKKK